MLFSLAVVFEEKKSKYCHHCGIHVVVVSVIMQKTLSFTMTAEHWQLQIVLLLHLQWMFFSINGENTSHYSVQGFDTAAME